MANHLIIGLGGTGGRIIRELRKRIYEQFQNNEPGNGIHIEYLYADTEGDLHNPNGWRVNGHDIRLDESQTVNIEGIPSGVFDQIDHYPEFQSIINDDLDTAKGMAPLIKNGITSQRRRVGRWLFSYNLNQHYRKDNFLDAVNSAVNKLGNDNITFHICASLAGGLGSGALMDVIAQIRSRFPFKERPDQFKIRLFVYLPEQEMEHPEYDAGFYQANGYAALQELNALSINAFHPINLKDPINYSTGDSNRLLAKQQPFEVCYVFSNTTENGNIWKLGDLPAIVANFLYQSIFHPGRINLFESSDYAECPEYGMDNKPVHSRKFFSFGTLSAVYPEKTIQDFFAYNYAQQAIKQILFNCWSEGKGFQECAASEVGYGFTEKIQHPETRLELMLDYSHLTLEKPITTSSENANGMDYQTLWKSQLDYFVESAKVEEKKNWISAFNQQCKDYFDRGFRNEGVHTFFNNQSKNIHEYATVIRNHIESKLLDDFATNRKSLVEIGKYLALLTNNIRFRIEQYGKQIDRLQNDELPQLEEEAKKKKDEFDVISWIRNLVSKTAEKTLVQYKDILCDYQYKATQVEALGFARQLMAKIADVLENTLEVIQAIKDNLLETNKDLNIKADALFNSLTATAAYRIKQCDIGKVEANIARCLANHESQSYNAEKIRESLLASLKKKDFHSFEELYHDICQHPWSKKVIDTARSNALTDLERIAEANPADRITGGSILGYLRHYASDNQIQDFAKMLVYHSQVLVHFNPEETCKKLTPSILGATLPYIRYQITIPAANNEAEEQVRTKLIDAFCLLIPHFDSKQVQVGHDKDEITCMTVTSGFPLRYLSNLIALREKYESLVNTPDGELTRKLLHIENFETPLPSLV